MIAVHVEPGEEGEVFLGAVRVEQMDVRLVIGAGRSAGGDEARVGIFLPGKASPEVVQRAAAAIKAAMAAPDMAEGLAPYGLDITVNTPAELARAVKEENAAWGPVVKRVGFTPES